MNKQVILDTDIISFYMRKDSEVLQNYQRHIQNFGFLYITRISVIEILGGLKAKNAPKQIQDFNSFLSLHQILELTPKAGEKASDIFAELYQKGKHSGNYDILIASIAISNDFILCTNNTKDYQNISNLQLVNWKI